jgi:hypothetical protein
MDDHEYQLVNEFEAEREHERMDATLFVLYGMRLESLMPSLARAYIRSEVGQNKESLSVVRT